MKYSEILAGRIRQLCNERGITINRLAHMSGLKQSTVDNIIHGASTNPRLGTLQKISTAFDMSVSEFLDFKELDEYDLWAEKSTDGKGSQVRGTAGTF